MVEGGRNGPYHFKTCNISRFPLADIIDKKSPSDRLIRPLIIFAPGKIVLLSDIVSREKERGPGHPMIY